MSANRAYFGRGRFYPHTLSRAGSGWQPPFHVAETSPFLQVMPHPLRGRPVRPPHLPALYTPAPRCPDHTGKMPLGHQTENSFCVPVKRLKLLLLHCPLWNLFILITDSVKALTTKTLYPRRSTWKTSISSCVWEERTVVHSLSFSLSLTERAMKSSFSVL